MPRLAKWLRTANEVLDVNAFSSPYTVDKSIPSKHSNPMDTRTIYVTEADEKRLRPLIASMQNSREDLRALEGELRQARVVPPAEIPPDVITMNSKARLRDLETGEEMIYTLVFPDKASVEDGRISVIAPIGTAMLGQRVGDEIEWQVPAGPVRLKVEEVLYQPEASGHFHL